MKTKRQTQREAKRPLSACVWWTGSLDEARVRQAWCKGSSTAGGREA